MADLNKVFLIGRLTFDPELRHTPGGAAVTDLRIATSRQWTDKAGEKKEDTLYVDVTVWQRQAETCAQYLKKGSAVHVEGFLKMDVWDDKTSGEKRSKIKVEADRVQFLDSKKGDAADAPDAAPEPAQRAAAPASRPAATRPAPAATAARRAPAPPPPGDEDIPF